MTLLSLASELRTIFSTATILHKIHNKMAAEISHHINDQSNNSKLNACANLLPKLDAGLASSDTKCEQDIHLSLYLETLFKYVSIIDRWLSKDDFLDNQSEFPILNGNDFEIGFFRIISTQIVQIGRNIHLLRMLGKLNLVNESSQTLHEELIEKVLAQISDYFKSETEIAVCDAIQEDCYKFPAICADFCKYPTEMDRLENLIDASEGFLMQVFESFFTDSAETHEPIETSLYERIAAITRHVFPAQEIVADTFAAILRDRYDASGLVVKNILLGDFKLRSHFALLHHVFLFKDDLIVCFYRRIFDMMETRDKWGNNVWLTTHLHDILMDVHPENYVKLSVVVKDTWKNFLDDPLKACATFKIQYKIDWPVSLIITDENLETYKEMFYFILQIKWALYTLNYLHFFDIEPKGSKLKYNRALKILLNRLKVLRFELLNIFNSIQHYVLGFAVMGCWDVFEKDFERADDLNTLAGAHARFITDCHVMATRLRDFNEDTYGFNLLLYLVHKLRIMWKNFRDVNDDDLAKCEKNFKECYKNLHGIINPV